MMVFRTQERDSILNKEPYATFVKRFEKLQSITNEKVQMRIISDDSSKKTGLTKNGGTSDDS